MTRRKPILIFDGTCHFCRRWIERWKETTGDKVVYRSSQEVGAQFPEISPQEFDEAVQWVGKDGERASGAGAVFSALAAGEGWLGKQLLSAYREGSAFTTAADMAYRVVARHRSFFSLLTRGLWGDDARRPTFVFSSRVFFHLLGLTYLIAFRSYWVQIAGLLGEQGITPASAYFQHAGEVLGPTAFWHLPSFLWLGASDHALYGWCGAGIVAALLLMLGLAPVPCLIFLWFDYLSLCSAGQVFYEFQWDSLLIETGFLAIFFAPWTLRLTGWASPPRLARFLLIWLLFRLMFSSGVVKLASGDLNWWHATALNFHYFTQPLPTPGAWFAQQMPAWWQWLSVKVMFVIELGLPFLLFFPRRLRLFGVAGIAFLQLMIALTGNYGFFNLLALILCLLAVDDIFWRRWFGWALQVRPARFLPRSALWVVVFFLWSLSLVPLAGLFPSAVRWLTPAALLYDLAMPFRTVNSYGLFAVMTTERREIIIQGSNDGLHWKSYVFRYKPGPSKTRPRWAAPYMPRLDWQMWFAALGSFDDNPWFANFLIRLMQNSSAVLGLLADNPFPGGPPRYLRALSDNYSFTTPAERKRTGDWWTSQPSAIYCPEVSLPDEKSSP